MAAGAARRASVYLSAALALAMIPAARASHASLHVVPFDVDGYFAEWFQPHEMAAEVGGALVGTPDTRDLVTLVIVPAFDRVVDRSLALQNAVLRHCLVENEASRAALIPAYRETIEASAALLPLAFGGPDTKDVAMRLLSAEPSVSPDRRAEVKAVVRGSETDGGESESATQPTHVLGLPSLEVLLLQASYPNEQPRESRCALATAVASDISDKATRARDRWVTGDVVAHWRRNGDRDDGRKRVRDLIQGTIDAADVLAADLERFFRHMRGEQDFRFADKRVGIAYLQAGTEGLKTQLGRIETLLGPDPEALDRFETIARTLSASAMMIEEAADGPAANQAICVLTFEHARADIVEHLPHVFSFERDEFSRTRVGTFHGEVVH